MSPTTGMTALVPFVAIEGRARQTTTSCMLPVLILLADAARGSRITPSSIMTEQAFLVAIRRREELGLCLVRGPATYTWKALNIV